MHLTLIVTVDAVKSLSHLDLLVHALNLQTRSDFDVVLHNQTLKPAEELVAELRTPPGFGIRVFDVPREDFLGRYPIWDLYALHARLVDEEPVGDYLMALHMEEFPDVDYVEHLLAVLERERFDVLFGNLTRTRATLDDVAPLFAAGSAAEFAAAVTRLGLESDPHWAFDHRPVLWRRNPYVFWSFLERWVRFGFRKAFRPTPRGFTPLGRYVAEDVYAMSTDFARRHDWFLRGRHLYFEDVHILNLPGVGDLTGPLRARTAFPVYFDRRRMYHVEHPRYYFQLEDDTFTSEILSRSFDDPALLSLQQAIREYRAGRLDFAGALAWSRRNPMGQGTQNLNFRYHMEALAATAAGARGRGSTGPPVDA